MLVWPGLRTGGLAMTDVVSLSVLVPLGPSWLSSRPMWTPVWRAVSLLWAAGAWGSEPRGPALWWGHRCTGPLLTALAHPGVLGRGRAIPGAQTGAMASQFILRILSHHLKDLSERGPPSPAMWNPFTQDGRGLSYFVRKKREETHVVISLGTISDLFSHGHPCMQPAYLALMLPLVWGRSVAGPQTVPMYSIFICFPLMLTLSLVWPPVGSQVPSLPAGTLPCTNHSLVAILLIFLEHIIKGELCDQEGGRILHLLPCSPSLLWGPCRA